MILFKNVDIKDLESILSKGILSLNESGNDNWTEGKRGNNSRDVVYLFKPLTDVNSFCNYGAALLEIDIPDNVVMENSLGNNDVNKGKYVEYVTDKVPVEYIKAIYIPELFKERFILPDNVAMNITWCGMKANYYSDNGKVNCPKEVLEQFAKTAKLLSTSQYGFFHGSTEKRVVIDLYDVQYIF